MSHRELDMSELLKTHIHTYSISSNLRCISFYHLNRSKIRINLLLLSNILGLVAVIMWLTSLGTSGKIKKAQTSNVTE